MTEDHSIRGLAEVALEDIEELLANTTGPGGLRLDTDDLGEFWHAMTEGCTLRLIRLKPEIVRHVDGHHPL